VRPVLLVMCCAFRVLMLCDVMLCYATLCYCTASFRSLPPILTLSLNRFVWDLKKGERYKVSTAWGVFSFQCCMSMLMIAGWPVLSVLSAARSVRVPAGAGYGTLHGGPS